MPSGGVRAMSIAAPEPLLQIAEEEPEAESEEDEPPPLPPSRWALPHTIIAVSLVVLVVSMSLALLRDRARDGELFRTAQAKRARDAVTAVTPPPVTPTVVTVAEMPPSPAPELAAIAAASASESAKNERFEAQVALEIGDIVRAERVAQHAVLHDPADADGWLLLTASQLELNQVEASRASLKSCADRATRGPHWECIALMRDNGPN